MYTDTIHDTALIKENKIIEGPSFQLRNNYNTDCLNNSVIKNGTLRLRKKVKGTVLSLLTGGGGNLITGIGYLMFYLELKYIKKK